MNEFEEISLPKTKVREFGRVTRSYTLVDSTNQRLLEWAAEGAPHGASCIAQAQAAGRGRQGRSWSSPRGEGLYASLLLRPTRSLAGLGSFSLVVALALAAVLRRLGLVELGLKWPNDLWWGERKLAGILLEARGGRSPILVVGVGLNLRSPRDDRPTELEGRAVSLEEAGITPPAALELWAELLGELESRWEVYGAEGFAAFQQEWRSLDLLLEREIVVAEGEQRYPSVAEGVDPEGRLVIRRRDGTRQHLGAGEVHLETGARR